VKVLTISPVVVTTVAYTSTLTAWLTGSVAQRTTAVFPLLSSVHPAGTLTPLSANCAGSASVITRFTNVTPVSFVTTSV
jgi:hypothetical protein